MLRLSLPNGRRNVLKAGLQHSQFVKDMAPKEYQAFWPFTPAVRCAVVGFDNYDNKMAMEITLNHETKVFERVLFDGQVIQASNPYSLLVQLAQLGLVRPKAPAGNWGELYFTLDNGQTYIKGFHLTRANAAHFEMPLTTVHKTVLQRV